MRMYKFRAFAKKKIQENQKRKKTNIGERQCFFQRNADMCKRASRKYSQKVAALLETAP